MILGTGKYNTWHVFQAFLQFTKLPYFCMEFVTIKSQEQKVCTLNCKNQTVSSIILLFIFQNFTLFLFNFDRCMISTIYFISLTVEGDSNSRVTGSVFPVSSGSVLGGGQLSSGSSVHHNKAETLHLSPPPPDGVPHRLNSNVNVVTSPSSSDSSGAPSHSNNSGKIFGMKFYC